jgi:hypothetical protein
LLRADLLAGHVLAVWSKLSVDLDLTRVLAAVAAADLTLFAVRSITLPWAASLGFQREVPVSQDLHVMFFTVALGIGEPVAMIYKTISSHFAS